MTYAYFNDCLPRRLPIQTYANALEQTAQGFKHLHDMFSKGPSVLGGIITNSGMTQYVLDGDTVTLERCIKEIGDRDMRNLLIAWAANYPETAFFQEDVDEEAILNEDYHLAFDDDRQNAINLILAKYNGAFLFSLNLHEVLSVNKVKVHGNSHDVLVHNLYCNEEGNMNFIAQIIKDAYNSTLDTQSQIETILQHSEKHNAYDIEYSKLSTLEQTNILNTWKEARERGILTPFNPDNNVIRQTEGPKKIEKQIGPVYELRIRKPRELRVYFQYVNKIYYLLDIFAVR